MVQFDAVVALVIEAVAEVDVAVVLVAVMVGVLKADKKKIQLKKRKTNKKFQ